MSQVTFYPKSDDNQLFFKDWRCSICRETDPSNHGGTVVHPNGERHPLHFDCLKESLKYKSECPCCRDPIDPRSLPLKNKGSLAIKKAITFLNNQFQSISPVGREALIDCGAASIPLLVGCRIHSPLAVILGGIVINTIAKPWEKLFKLEADITNRFLKSMQKISKLSIDKAGRLEQNYLDSIAFSNDIEEIEALKKSIGKLPEVLQTAAGEIFKKAREENPEPLRNDWQEAVREKEKHLSLKNSIEIEAKKHNFRYWSVYILNRAALLIIIQQTAKLFLNAKK